MTEGEGHGHGRPFRYLGGALQADGGGRKGGPVVRRDQLYHFMRSLGEAQMSLTIERLKSWLNANQPGRERMCAQILALMDGYSDIRPRRRRVGLTGVETSRLYTGALTRRSARSDSRTTRAIPQKTRRG